MTEPARDTAPPTPDTSGAITVVPEAPAPRAVPTSVQIIDQLGDIVGVVALTVLCAIGKVSAELAVVSILGLLGIQNGIRTRSARGVSVVGALILAGYGAPLAAGAAEAARRVSLSTLVMLTALALHGCPAPAVTREPAAIPPPTSPPQGTTDCHDGAPWRRGPEGEWSQADRRCDRLVVGDAGAVCCLAASPLRPGVLVHACVLPDRCTTEVTP